MSKSSSISELTNLLVKSLRHRIGGIVNFNEIYAQKYSRDAEVLFREVEKVFGAENWNNYDRDRIKQELRKKLKAELERCEFLDERKFEVMDEEINKALANLWLK